MGSFYRIIDINQSNELELKTNENILGSAWFVEELVSVESSDEEILQLNSFIWHIQSGQDCWSLNTKKGLVTCQSVVTVEK